MHLLPPDKPRQLVKAEANLLRLPIFSLYKQNLKNLDGFQCRGRITLNGQVYQYQFAASRNARTLYPGPLARAAHLAFLSLITERGLPAKNPIDWTWRDLCRRMSIVPSGRTVEHLKLAICSTAGLMLYSQDALYAKSDEKPLRSVERALHLYDSVVFTKDKMPGGGLADRNYVWFSDWYLANLNSLFTAPLDYELWLYLDRKSPIASRLYEFLLLKFYSGVPSFRINYENLVNLLPLRPEPFHSHAKRQLDPHLRSLVDVHILDAESAWTKNKDGVLQLLLSRGPRLLPLQSQDGSDSDLALEEITDELEVQELRNIKPPEWTLIGNFYLLLAGDEHARPTDKEMVQARQLLQAHGDAKARALVPLLVKHLKQKWPEAKTFGSIGKYLPDALAEYERELQAQAFARQEADKRRLEHEEQVLQRKRDQQLAELWEEVSAEKRAEIEDRVLAQNPILKRGSRFVRMLCLAELAAWVEQELRD